MRSGRGGSYRISWSSRQFCGPLVRGNLLCLFIAILCSSTINRSANGQLRRGVPQRTPRQLLDLELDQQRAESNIAENRVTRQAEVSRLEGRLLEIESRLDRLASSSSADHGLAMISLFDQLSSASKQAIDSSPTADTTQGNDRPWRSVRPELLRLVAEDYILAMEVELARARIDRLKLLDGFRSLQQMQARGLASEPQLELKELEYKQAMLRVERLEKLTAGYRKLLPQTTDDAPQKAGASPPDR